METITVVGAGFSGLTTAYFLTKKGFRVRIIEQTDRAGGLIKTIRTPQGLVETAANGLLSSVRLEAMCNEIGVPLLPTLRDARKRFIYRGAPKQVPLTIGDVFSGVLRFTANAASLRPHAFESIASWGRRVIGVGPTDYLLTPALGGIYAGDPERLSASLIFGKAVLPDHLKTTRPEKGKIHGTVAPPDGMQQLIEGLTKFLEKAGTEFVFDRRGESNPDTPTVICLSASRAAECLADTAPQLSRELLNIEMLSLATVTCFYPPESEHLKGFGCLFPRDQNFRARGVLFNNYIFEGRGPAHAETWIFGGALDPKVVELTDQTFKELIASERERFYGKRDELLDVRITRWPNALPHYSIELEHALAELSSPPANIWLVGNYLGRIGLAKILERAAFVADAIAAQSK